MRCLAFFLAVSGVIGLSGCATYWDHESLQQRVGTLEDRVKKLEAEKNAAEKFDAERRQKLENCITVNADEAFWSYVRINGTKKGEGTYFAPQYVWDQARRQKMDKIEECKLLYGHQ
jgi:outer membrane murein-binding lipoprotein Lpp